MNRYNTAKFPVSTMHPVFLKSGLSNLNLRSRKKSILHTPTHLFQTLEPHLLQPHGNFLLGTQRFPSSCSWALSRAPSTGTADSLFALAKRLPKSLINFAMKATWNCSISIILNPWIFMLLATCQPQIHPAMPHCEMSYITFPVMVTPLPGQSNPVMNNPFSEEIPVISSLAHIWVFVLSLAAQEKRSIPTFHICMCVKKIQKSLKILMQLVPPFIEHFFSTR